MRRSSLLTGAALGAATSLPLMALFFLGSQLAGLPFVPFDVFDWLARVLPGGLITLFIETIVMVIRGLQLGATDEVAKSIEQLMALAMMLGVGIAFGAVIALAVERTAWSGRQVGVAGGIALLLVTLAVEIGSGLSGNWLITLVWLAVLLVGWGALLGGWIDRSISRETTAESRSAFSRERRAFLTRSIGGSVAVALAAWAAGLQAQGWRRPTGADEPLPEPAATAHAIARATPTTSAEARTLAPAPGSRPPVTANDQFYRTDINLLPLSIDGSVWTLQVKGLFDNPRPLTLADLQAYKAVNEPITLACISNPVGGDLIGNAYWTGLRIRDLLSDLGIRAEARELQVLAADGFYETVTMADLLDPRTLLVYGMNGTSLPAVHGFPLRILIPNRYGMKQPKWITGIEAIDREGSGYWVDRGWSKEARPQIVAVIDSVAKDSVVDGRVPVGGIAWAGDRGISLVEVQVDNGPWEPAALLPTLGPLTWTQWRYDWPLVPGRHTFRARATDGTGAFQVDRLTEPHPDGATGYHAVTVAI